MAFTKYQKVESAKVVSPGEHKKISDDLHKINKTSAQNLSDEERQKVFDAKHK